MKKLKILILLVALIPFGMNIQAQYEKRSDPNSYSKPVIKAIAYGITAPNPHNTQSWVIDTLSSTEMLLYIKHLLPETDPPSRQIHMGAGCFIELASIGMSKEGYDVLVEYLPHGEYTVKTYQIADKPIAKLTLVPNANRKRDVLFDHIYMRGTNRKPYKGNMIKQSEFDNISLLMGDCHSDMIFYNIKQDMQPYLDVFKEAMAIELQTKATNEETRSNFRFSEKQRSETKDGISIPQMGIDGFKCFVAEKSLKKGDSLVWHSHKVYKASIKGMNKAIESSKGLVFFKTNTNTMLDWVKTGRDYARFNIAIAKLGIVNHPYNQVIQEYKELASLQKRFRSMNRLNENEKIQMIVRIGRAKPTYKSWRKDVGAFIRK